MFGFGTAVPDGAGEPWHCPPGQTTTGVGDGGVAGPFAAGEEAGQFCDC